ncbi:MAG: hypothetical protein ABIO02_02220 [Patescibacteria group bacterium]
MKKLSVVFIIIIGIVFLFFYYVFSKNQEIKLSRKPLIKDSRETGKKDPLQLSASPSPQPIKPGWKLFKNNKYSFIYPENSSIQSASINSVILTYKDSNKLGNTYTLQIDSLPSINTIEGYASQAQEEARVECHRNARISGLTETDLSMKKAQKFTITNCLGVGSTTEYYIDNNMSVIQIGVNISGSMQEVYKEITDTVLSSLQL